MINEPRQLPAPRLAFSIALCYSAPIAAYFLLNAGGPLLPLLAYCTLVEALFVARRLLRRRDVVTALLCIVLAAGAFVVYAAIDITPGSAFLAWFKLVSLGTVGGTIAYMFCVDVAFFSSLFAGLFVGIDELTALFGYLFMNTVLAAVIFENLPATVGAAALLVGFLLYRSLRRSKDARLGPVVASLQLILAASAVAAGATSLMIPNAIVERTFSIPLEGVVSQLFPGFPFLYNVPGYGHSFNPSDLGGRPALTSRPVLKVTARPGSTIYLRSVVFDTYTGNGWAMSEEARKRAHPPSKIVHRFPPAAATAGSDDIRVTVLIDFLAALPSTLDTQMIAPESTELPPLDYGSRATGYVLSVPVTAGFRLVDRIGPPAATAVPGRASINRREYLQSGDLPENVHALASRLRRPSPIATIAAIRDYLSANYSYTLDVKRSPPKSNAVADFLFGTHAGYCVQFASAFTVLARLDGIPARYVTGFLVNMPEHAGSAIVTGFSAHSWSEVFLDGRWRTVEATPPMMRSSELDPGYYRLFNPTDSAATRRQLEAVMGARVPPPAASRRHSPIPLTPTAVGLAGLAAAAIILRALVLAALPRRTKVRRIVRKLLRRTRRMAIPDPGRRGWREWATAAGLATSRPVNMHRAAAIVHLLFFADRTARRRESRYLTAVYRCVRMASRRRVTMRPSLHRIAH